jgi:hypothetical protein
MSETGWRSLVKDLAPFRHLVPDFEALSPKSAKGKAKAKAKAKPTTTTKTKPATTTEAEIIITPKLPAKVVAAMKTFFDSVHWTHERFTKEWRLTYTAMLTGIGRSDRLSERLGARILSLCCLHWNPDSVNKSRDYFNLSLVVTIEIALVGAYRELLVHNCFGARALRSDLQGFFLAHTEKHTVDGTSGDILSVYKWEFADKIGSTSELASELAAHRYDPKTLSADWEAHRLIINKKKDSVSSFIMACQKNKLFQCSDPSAPAGTIESSVLESLKHLAEVFRPFTSLPYLPHSFYPLQVMYKNQARIDHKASGKKGNFNMGSVVIPTLEWRPHAESSAHRAHVRVLNLCCLVLFPVLLYLAAWVR